jgi:alpha-L-rhamnosidase
LLCLQNESLVLAFNNSRQQRTPLCVALAEKGEVWQWQRTLEDEEAEFSYPTLLQTDDGFIHLVYTYRRENIHYACFTETWLRKEKINET